MAPPFYKGAIPFSYTENAIFEPGSMGSPEINIPIYQDYQDWRTILIYKDSMSSLEGLPDGALTVDPQTGRVLAEAKRTAIVSGKGIEIEERHYGQMGELVFSCKSFVSFMGWKERESAAVGQKVTEYYAIFPTGT
jgi:hypothetical protein